MTFDPYKLIKYHLYLLQLENYELIRFLNLLVNKGWFPPKEQRKDLVWTLKAAVTFTVAEIFIVLVAFALYGLGVYPPFGYAWQDFITFLVSIYFLDFLSPAFLLLATIIVWPLDFAVKFVIVQMAKRKISGLTNLKIVGIAGSYGKTTMKEVLHKVLSAKFAVASTPDSINTPLGVARWILEELDEKTRIAIVEMGEHYKGDIAELCKIVTPDFAVITGINEAHMERMGSIKEITETIFEIVDFSKDSTVIFLNADDPKVASARLGARKVQTYKKADVTQATFNTSTLAWQGQLEGVGDVVIRLLGEYALGDVSAAAILGRMFGMNAVETNIGISKIRPINHRLEPSMRANNVLVIDDAYNGNPDGVEEAIKVLARFKDRRKIYITPGLVEAGSAAADVHRKIGKQLASVADVVILIKNSVTPFIAEGLGARVEGQANKPQIIWFDSAIKAHSSLESILQANDVILFQNDWGDQYL